MNHMNFNTFKLYIDSCYYFFSFLFLLLFIYLFFVSSLIASKYLGHCPSDFQICIGCSNSLIYVYICRDAFYKWNNWMYMHKDAHAFMYMNKIIYIFVIVNLACLLYGQRLIFFHTGRGVCFIFISFHIWRDLKHPPYKVSM